MARKLKSFLHNTPQADDIVESSFFAKGYALIEASRHEQSRQRLNSLASKLNNTASRGRTEADPAKRNQYLFDSLVTIAEALPILGELSRCNIYVSASASVLEENIKDAIEKALRNK